jgi:transposase
VRLPAAPRTGDKYLRKLLVIGATSLVRRARHYPATVDPRLADLLARKPVRVATVATANKMARIVWAIMTRGEVYQPAHVPALAT